LYFGWKLHGADLWVVVRLRVPAPERLEMRKKVTASAGPGRQLGIPGLNSLQEVRQVFGHGLSERDVGGIRLTKG
jgi:hypothetical protein